MYLWWRTDPFWQAERRSAAHPPDCAMHTVHWAEGKVDPADALLGCRELREASPWLLMPVYLFGEGRLGPAEGAGFVPGKWKIFGGVCYAARTSSKETAAC